MILRGKRHAHYRWTSDRFVLAGHSVGAAERHALLIGVSPG